MDLAEYRARLRELKKKSTQVTMKNLKMVDEEAKQLAMKGKPKVYKMDEEDPAEGVKEKEQKNHREKLMNYNMKEYEEWELAQQRRKARGEHGGNADLQEIAKYSYDKQLKQNQCITPVSTSSKRTHKIHKDYATGKVRLPDNKNLVNQLAKDSKHLATKRYTARSKEIERNAIRNTPGGYINVKNKQFNEKLDRQLKKRDT